LGNIVAQYAPLTPGVDVLKDGDEIRKPSGRWFPICKSTGMVLNPVFEARRPIIRASGEDFRVIENFLAAANSAYAKGMKEAKP
jgi:hypothetical protein